MSRREIPALLPRHRVIVGWDHPMQTYFAQVINKNLEQTDADEKFALWIGCGVREIYEVDDLARRLSRYAVLDPDTRAKLYGDKDDGK